MRGGKSPARDNSQDSSPGILRAQPGRIAARTPPSRHHPHSGTAHASTPHAAGRPAPRRPCRQPGGCPLDQTGVEGLDRRRRQRDRHPRCVDERHGQADGQRKGFKANTSYHVSLRKGSCSHPKTVLAKLGLVPHQRLRRGVGLEVDQQQPDGLGLVGAVREDHRPVHRGHTSSARRSGTTTRPASASRATTSTCPS